MTEEEDGSLKIIVLYQLVPEPCGPWSYRARPSKSCQIFYYIQDLKKMEKKAQTGLRLRGVEKVLLHPTSFFTKKMTLSLRKND